MTGALSSDAFDRPGADVVPLTKKCYFVGQLLQRSAVRMVQSVDIRDGENDVSKFPGPLTLIPSLKKRWSMLVGAGSFTIAGILLSFGVGISFGGRIAGALTTAFF